MGGVSEGRGTVEEIRADSSASILAQLLSRQNQSSKRRHESSLMAGDEPKAFQVTSYKSADGVKRLGSPILPSRVQAPAAHRMAHCAQKRRKDRGTFTLRDALATDIERFGLSEDLFCGRLTKLDRAVGHCENGSSPGSQPALPSWISTRKRNNSVTPSFTLWRPRRVTPHPSRA